jgi:hypothetical protein
MAWELSAGAILFLRAAVSGNGGGHNARGGMAPHPPPRLFTKSPAVAPLRRRRARSLFSRMRHRFLGRRNLERHDLGIAGQAIKEARNNDIGHGHSWGHGNAD